jgi:asparagine synthetase B (glutamine-hydrolysing)
MIRQTPSPLGAAQNFGMCGIHAWISCSDASSDGPNDLCSGAEEDWLRRRGPDGVATVSLEVAVGASKDVPGGPPEREDHGDNQQQTQQLTHHQVHLRASVLQMRTEWQPQPVALLSSMAAAVVGQDFDDDDAPVPAAAGASAYFAWNGEIYEAGCGDDDDPAAVSSFLDNDTLYMAKRLTRTLDWSAPFSSTSSRDEQRDTIVATLSCLTNAEYAMCIVTNQSIFYARDPWGRRSLLTKVSSNRGGGNIMFQVASVAVASTVVGGTGGTGTTLEQPDDDRLWTEVPPGILYEYHIETNETHATPFSTTTTAELLLVDQSPTTTAPPPPLSTTATTTTALTVSAAILEGLLDGAVQRRLRGHTSCSVLFSGGLDSTLIAALASRHCRNITLLTVSFVDDDTNTTGCDTDTDNNTVAVPQAADAITAQASYRELVQLYPDANITWHHKVVPYYQVEAVRDRIQELIRPKSTVMDWNIATALWFAASLAKKNNDNDDNDRLLLSGLGADELLGGYRRHQHRGAVEVQRDQDRLWERNLGRDDRILSDHGTEVRFPYLDTNVVAFCRAQQDFLLQHNTDTATDKAVLRQVATHLGLVTAARATKRAIQFGSRIAHVSDTKRFGSRRKATGTTVATTASSSSS